MNDINLVLHSQVIESKKTVKVTKDKCCGTGEGATLLWACGDRAVPIQRVSIPATHRSTSVAGSRYPESNTTHWPLWSLLTPTGWSTAASPRTISPERNRPCLSCTWTTIPLTTTFRLGKHHKNAVILEVLWGNLLVIPVRYLVPLGLRRGWLSAVPLASAPSLPLPTLSLRIR